MIKWLKERNTKEKKNDKASKRKGVKDWKEDEASMLTERLEERPSICHVFNKILFDT